MLKSLQQKKGSIMNSESIANYRLFPSNQCSFTIYNFDRFKSITEVQVLHLPILFQARNFELFKVLLKYLIYMYVHNLLKE